MNHPKSSSIPIGKAIRIWTRIGLLSFGGPAGQIATMHRLLVDEHAMIGEQRFLRALNFCMLLPGPEAQQLATYAGWITHGVRGGLAAGLLFILPGAAFMILLSALYAYFGNVPVVESAFLGIKAAVLAIVVQALLRVSGRTLQNPISYAIAVAAFIALVVVGFPFPLVVLCAGVAGAFLLAQTNSNPAETSDEDSRRWLGPALGSAVAWGIPVAASVVLLGDQHVLSELGLFFSKVAMVTFGGAYAVLSYVGDQAVSTYEWILPGVMLDGLGLAETTPGPLVLVNVFVGFQAGFADAGLIMGLLGALMTLWVTFAPSFLWIFGGAPFVDRLQRNKRLAGALSGITAAVVGVIANLALWFALQVLFPEKVGAIAESANFEPLIWDRFQPTALILVMLAFVALFLFRLGLISLIALGAVVGVLLQGI